MKRILKVLFSIFEVILILYVIAITTCLLCRNHYGSTQFGDYSLIIVNEDNEEDLSNFQKGDLVIIEDADYDDVSVGDVLYYYDSVDEEYVIKTGTVSDKTGDKKQGLYYFQGVEQSISEKRVIGTYDGMSYHTVGAVLGFLQSRIGFLLCVILPIMVLFIYQIYSLIIMVKEDKESE